MALEPKTETRQIPFTLTPAQIATKQANLVTKQTELAALREQIRIANRDNIVALRQLLRAVDRLEAMIRTGIDDKAVECTWTPALTDTVWVITRNDTGELIDVCLVTEADLQPLP